MATDENYIVDRAWAPVQLAGEDIMTGDFKILSRSNNPIGFVKSETIPDDQEMGVAFFRTPEDFFPIRLLGGEKLWARSPRGPIKIGVISDN